MSTEVISLKPGVVNMPEIERVAAALSGGALVAFPTETVYGLAANAAIGESVERLRDVKGRVPNQPFTVHIGRREDCEKYVPRLTAVARRFVRKGWPGPLTLIFPVDDPSAAPIYADLSAPGVESIYNENTVGLRFPNHPYAAGLLARSGAPVIASSANRAGQPPPTDAQEVLKEMEGKIDIVVDGGSCRYKQASTIVALSGEGYKLLREGVYKEATIQRLATLNILFVCTGNTCRSPMAEGICRQLLAEKLGCAVHDLLKMGITVSSAGTMALPGHPASSEAVEVCRQRGIDLTSHRANGLTLEMIHPADYIFTMGRQHLAVVRTLAPSDAARSQLLDTDTDISDPVGGTIEDYERTARRITEALRVRLEEVEL